MLVNDDQEIISLLKKVDNKELAFNLTMDKYKERIYMYVRRMLISHEDTDDAVQNTFVKVWLSLDSFRGDSSLYTWIYRIATNEALSFLKNKKRFQNIPVSAIENKPEGRHESIDNLSGNEIEKKLLKAIHSLPEKQRLVFNLKYYEEMKYEDMSAILKTSTGALKASYHHAVKKISTIMKSG